MANEVLANFTPVEYVDPSTAGAIVPVAIYGSKSGSEFYPSPPPTTSFGAPPTFSIPIRGIRMPHGVKTRLYWPIRVPAGFTVSTGVTFELQYVMSPNPFNADLTGTKVYMEVACASLLSGTNTLDDSCFAAAGNVPTVAQSAALPSTATSAGVLVNQTGLAITTAHCIASDNSTAFAASVPAIIRVSRIGDNALDTNLGDIILVNVFVFAT